MKVAPSILSADFSDLKKEIIDITDKGADYIHLDIMDGHFVPNITFGPGVVKALKPYSKLPFDVHLMIENPDNYLKQFVYAGANIITVHVEACKHLHRTLQSIKDLGVLAGVSLNPHTPIECIKYVLSLCDLVLVMSVNPGFGGQSFIDTSLEKIRILKELREKNHYHYLIEVDGGINDKTSQLCKEEGVDIVVAGSYIFNHTNRLDAINSLR
ncbi:MAG TPA: ribulose-phosphate 3-epimerase [Haloplasmataceae bacterium]